MNKNRHIEHLSVSEGVPATAEQAVPLYVKLAIISHSRTRRVSLAKVLKNFPHIDCIALDSNFDAGRTLAGADLILLDSHNVGPAEQQHFHYLQTQTSVPIIVCNSSEIPLDRGTRADWAAHLTGQLLEALFMTSIPDWDETDYPDFAVADTAATATGPTVTTPASTYEDKNMNGTNSNEIVTLDELFARIEDEVEEDGVANILEGLSLTDEPESSEPLFNADESYFDFAIFDDDDEPSTVAEFDAGTDRQSPFAAEFDAAQYAGIDPETEEALIETVEPASHDPDMTLSGDAVDNDATGSDGETERPPAVIAARDRNDPDKVQTVLHEIAVDFEHRRRQEILNRLPMQRFDEVDNENPIITASELNFDYSNMEAYAKLRQVEIEAEAEAENSEDKRETVTNAKATPVEHQAKQDNQDEDIDLAKLFDIEIDNSDLTEMFSAGISSKSGNLKTWFSGMVSALHRKKRKAG